MLRVRSPEGNFRFELEASADVSQLLAKVRHKLDNARRTFESERVSDPQTIDTIRAFYRGVGYILDPHSAVGVTAAERSIRRSSADMPHISLSTAHPAKFAGAVELALGNESGFNFEEKVLPAELVGLEKKEKRVISMENDWKAVGELLKAKVEDELRAEEGS